MSPRATTARGVRARGGRRLPNLLNPSRRNPIERTVCAQGVDGPPPVGISNDVHPLCRDASRGTPPPLQAVPCRSSAAHKKRRPVDQRSGAQGIGGHLSASLSSSPRESGLAYRSSISFLMEVSQPHALLRSRSMVHAISAQLRDQGLQLCKAAVALITASSQPGNSAVSVIQFNHSTSSQSPAVFGRLHQRQGITSSAAFS